MSMLNKLCQIEKWIFKFFKFDYYEQTIRF